MIECKRCNRLLAEDQFKVDARYKRGFTSWCAECHREANRLWYEANKEKHNHKAVSWRKANIEKAREISRNFSKRNAKARAQQHAEWAKENREKRNATCAKRKAAKLQATPKWVNWQKVEAIYAEARRLQDITGVKMHVDHIVPLQGDTVCGLHWEENLRVIPASENIAKKNKLVDEAARQPDLLIPETRIPPQQQAMDL